MDDANVHFTSLSGETVEDVKVLVGDLGHDCLIRKVASLIRMTAIVLKLGAAGEYQEGKICEEVWKREHESSLVG